MDDTGLPFMFCIYNILIAKRSKYSLDTAHCGDVSSPTEGKSAGPLEKERKYGHIPDDHAKRRHHSNLGK